MRDRLIDELKSLMVNIEAKRAETRFELQPRLARIIREMERSGEFVPSRARCLDAALRDEAIEAQFDNLPV